MKHDDKQPSEETQQTEQDEQRSLACEIPSNWKALQEAYLCAMKDGEMPIILSAGEARILSSLLCFYTTIASNKVVFAITAFPSMKAFFRKFLESGHTATQHGRGPHNTCVNDLARYFRDVLANRIYQANRDKN